MKVLHVQECPSWGGGSVQLIELAKGLVSRGHEAHIATDPGNELWKRARAAGLPLVGIETRSELNPAAIGRLAGVVLGRGIDIVNAHAAHAHSIGLAAAALTGRPFVLTRRVSFTPRDNAGSRLKYTAKAVTRVIAVSEAIRDVLVRYGVDPERIDVVYSGTDPAVFQRADGKDVRRAFGVAGNDVLVGKLANRYHSWKGHDTFVDAARIVLESRDDVVFAVVGKRTDDDRMEELVRAAGVERSFVLAGHRDDVPSVLSAFDVSVNASRAGEGLSGAVRESMAAGRPVVATDVGGNREIVEDGVTGKLVPPADPPALAAALLEVVEDPEAAHRMGAAAAELVRRRFTVDHMVERTIEVYGRALGRD
ncbi:MAG: glycosyltransferase [Candidatus Eisenbacteria bacterium]|nr:glycosyltransferase [Candidatus Eisenbacteria bacterium]